MLMSEAGELDWAQQDDEQRTQAPHVSSRMTGKSFLRWVMGQSAVDMARVERLSMTIHDDPDAAVNYVLRGEEYLKAAEYALAAVDFETALRLAQQQFEQEAWGIVAQTLRDRAEQGLEQAQRALQAKQE